MRLGKPWELMWGVGIIIGAAAWFLDVEKSPYFPVFVVFCMAYGAVAVGLMLKSERKSPKA